MTLRKRINLGAALEAAREEEKANRVPRWKVHYLRNREKILSRRRKYRQEHTGGICEPCGEYMQELKEIESDSTEETS